MRQCQLNAFLQSELVVAGTPMRNSCTVCADSALSAACCCAFCPNYAVPCFSFTPRITTKKWFSLVFE